MGAEDGHRASGNLLKFLDKHSSAAPQFVKDMGVVDDLMQHIHRWPEPFQGLIDYGDGPIDAGTEAPRSGKQYIHERAFFKSVSPLKFPPSLAGGRAGKEAMGQPSKRSIFRLFQGVRDGQRVGMVLAQKDRHTVTGVASEIH